uniref:Uncharacterized protein n=1 Tax=Arundo donax TaxID=35708 RepID=A0A0A9DP63_ARUDO
MPLPKPPIPGMLKPGMAPPPPPAPAPGPGLLVPVPGATEGGLMTGFFLPGEYLSSSPTLPTRAARAEVERRPSRRRRSTARRGAAVAVVAMATGFFALR